MELFDLVESSDAEVTELFSGVEAIVHCGYVPPIGEPSYASERRNVDMMERIYRLAMAAGVKRVVAASTNQAVEVVRAAVVRGPDRPGDPGATTRDRTPSTAGPRWRTSRWVSCMRAVRWGGGWRWCRSGSWRRARSTRPPSRIDRCRNYLRDIAGYISQRDLQQLFVRSVDAESIDDRVRRAVSDLLRRLEQRTHVLEHHQRPRGGRLRTRGRLGDRFRRRHRPDDRPRLRQSRGGPPAQKLRI